MPEPFRCPGCGKDVSDFMQYEAHYADQQDVRSKAARNARPNWPATVAILADNAHGTVCAWTRDYLAAEWLRQHPQTWSYA